jgi:hypothetical protein
VLIDDHVIPSGQPRPGRPNKLSDAEPACLTVAQVLLGARSEHRISSWWPAKPPRSR